jgi:hypothetical protein
MSVVPNRAKLRFRVSPTKQCLEEVALRSIIYSVRYTKRTCIVPSHTVTFAARAFGGVYVARDVSHDDSQRSAFGQNYFRESVGRFQVSQAAEHVVTTQVPQRENCSLDMSGIASFSPAKSIQPAYNQRPRYLPRPEKTSNP